MTCAADVASEDEQACEAAGEDDPLNWQSLVSREVLAALAPQEIKRQEVINGEPARKMKSPICI